MCASLEVSEKVGNITLFTIPASAFEEIFVNQEINQQKIFMGIQAEKDTTTFAFDLGIGCSPFLPMKTNPWIQRIILEMRNLLSSQFLWMEKCSKN